MPYSGKMAFPPPPFPLCFLSIDVCTRGLLFQVTEHEMLRVILSNNFSLFLLTESTEISLKDAFTALLIFTKKALFYFVFVFALMSTKKKK